MIRQLYLFDNKIARPWIDCIVGKIRPDANERRCNFAAATLRDSAELRFQRCNDAQRRAITLLRKRRCRITSLALQNLDEVTSLQAGPYIFNIELREI